MSPLKSGNNAKDRRLSQHDTIDHLSKRFRSNGEAGTRKTKHEGKGEKKKGKGEGANLVVIPQRSISGEGSLDGWRKDPQAGERAFQQESRKQTQAQERDRKP
jgi:hypothetical protein